MECFKCNQQQSSLVFYLSSSWRDQIYCQSKNNLILNQGPSNKNRNFNHRISLKKLTYSKLHSLSKLPQKSKDSIPIQTVSNPPISLFEPQLVKQPKLNSNLQKNRTIKQPHPNLNLSFNTFTYPHSFQIPKNTQKLPEPIPLTKIHTKREMQQTASTSKQSGYFNKNQSFIKKTVVQNSSCINSVVSESVPQIRVSTCRRKQSNGRSEEEEMEWEFQNDISKVMLELQQFRENNQNLLKPDQTRKRSTNSKISPSLSHIRNIEDLIYTKAQSVGDTVQEQSQIQYGLRSHNKIRNTINSSASISKNNSQSQCSLQKKSSSMRKDGYHKSITTL